MTILGISLSHDGTLSIIKNGEHVFSIGEERLNRKKAYIGFPFEALENLKHSEYVNLNDIDMVAISESIFIESWAYTYAFQLTENKTYYDLQNELKPKNFFIDDKDYLKIKSDAECKIYVKNKIKKLLNKNGINAPVEYINHHTSHAASAYYSSGFDQALAITMDGEGDLLSATVNVCKDGIIKKISETSKDHSAGYLYSEVTKRCGYKISRHEGKITGLAAYGNYKKHENVFDGLTEVKNGTLKYVNRVNQSKLNRIKNKLYNIFGFNFYMGHEELIHRVGNLSNEDLSASIQNHLEKRIVEIVKYWIQKTGIKKIVLAGGVFANVKFNQYISEIDDVQDLFIFPDMGDGGNAFGAACYVYFQKNKFNSKKFKIKNVYFGPSYDNNYVKKVLNQKIDKISFYKSENIAHDTARLIADGKIIGWFQGRMEYGPRALGNRSIIASPTDRNINNWLNKRMKRTEFMPFAPSCLYEKADDLFKIPKQSLKFPAEFMTITFEMNDEWVKKAPAISHIDNTARPQLVRKEANPKYYKLLSEYYKITGLPLFINTSFNVHEEPIVCKPEQGLDALLDSVIDVFVCNDFICRLKD
jgi:carbamoyltransferase